MVEKKQKNWKRNFWHYRKTEPGLQELISNIAKAKDSSRRDIGTVDRSQKRNWMRQITAFRGIGTVKECSEAEFRTDRTVETAACKKNEQNTDCSRKKKHSASKWRVSTRKLQKL